MLIETYFDQKVQWNFLQSGIFLTTLEHHLWFHGIRWTLSNKTSSFTECHGILSRSNIPWNSMELFLYSWVPWNSMEFHCIFLNSMEFHGTWLIWYFKNSYSKYCCWNLIADYISFWVKSHRNAPYCIDFNIVIRILNTSMSAKMAQGQRKWRAVYYELSNCCPCICGCTYFIGEKSNILTMG